MNHPRLRSAGRGWHMAWSATAGSLVALATSLLVVQAALRFVIANSDKYFDVLVARMLAPDFAGTATGLAAGSGVPVTWHMTPFSGHISATWLLGQRSELLLIGAGPVAGSLVLGLCVALAASRLGLPRWPLLLAAVASYTALSGAIQGVVTEWGAGRSEFEITMSSSAAVAMAGAWTLVFGGLVVALTCRTAGRASSTAVAGARRRSIGRVAVMTATALVASLASAGVATAVPVTGVAHGQGKWRAPGVDAAVAELQRVPGVSYRDAENDATGTPSMLVGLRSKLGGDDVPGWLHSHARVFGVAGTRGILKGDTQRLQLKDPSGALHVWYDQVIDQIPVYGARVGVHLDKSGTTVTAVTNGLRPDLLPPASTTPRISAEEAVTVAAPVVPGGRSWHTPVLTIYAGPAHAGLRAPAHLAWQVDIGDDEGNAERVFVDAVKGDRFVGVEQLSETALNRTIYNRYESGTIVRVEGQAATGDRDTNRAYDQTGAVYGYYKNTFGRESIDNKGLALRSVVHDPNNVRNASWNTNTHVMGFGDGMVSQDVTGHEMTHGVTEFTSGLQYSFQSGALNESLSDFFGEMTESYVKGLGRNDWLLGSDLVGISPFRDMRDPRAFGQPQTMSEYVTTCNDYGGVHTNSGIPNYAFYRMAYKLGYGTTEQIVYPAMTQYLAPASTFKDMYAALMEVAAQKYGVYDIITSTINSIWQKEVGVNASTPDPVPSGCGGTGTVTCSTLGALYDHASALDSDGASLAEVAGSLVHLYNLSTVGQDAAVVYYSNLFLSNRDGFNAVIKLEGDLLDRLTEALQLWQPVLDAVGTDQADRVIVTQQQIDSANAFADGVIAAAKAQGAAGDHLVELITTERARINAQSVVGQTVQQAQDYLDSVVAAIPPAAPGPAAALVTAFDNTAVSQDTDTDKADLDGHGLSMSAQALATAGVTPGSTITRGGIAFRWPTQSGTGAADNVVAKGQNIAVSGTGDTLGFLASSSLGISAGAPLSGKGTIHYSDGTSQRYLITTPDWHSTAAGPALTSAYTNAPGNTKQNTPAGVWYAGVTLLPGRTPVSVELPGANASTANGTPRLHVFAMAIGTAAPELTDTFSNVSVTQDTATGYGDMDGWGSSMSAQALAVSGAKPGSTVTHGGLSFIWPTTAGVTDAGTSTGTSYGEPDNTLAAGQTVAVSGTRGGTLGFLVAGANGAASGTATIHYSDGTAQQFTLTGPDWFKTSGDVAVTAAYGNKLNDQRYQHVTYVHYVGVTLQSGRTPVSVTLPDVTSVPAKGSPILHVYAMARG